MESQSTLALIKPDAFPHADEIVTIIKNNGFVVAESTTLTLTEEKAIEFYSEHKGRSFFNNLISFMTSGKIMPLVLRKKDAVAQWRSLIGPTSVEKARNEAPTSIRARFGTDDTRNAAHGSDALDSAMWEIAFFFPDYKPPSPTEGNDAKEYLTRDIAPALTKALIEMCSVAPTKPFEWLGFYLLRLNDSQNDSRHEYLPRPTTARPADDAKPPGTTKRIFFVLGGPGSGKGTQCTRLVERFGFDHFSAGDLLRAEVKSGSDQGEMIDNMIKEGKIVPGHITIGLLRKAIEGSTASGILIDGFPRQLDQAGAFEKDVSDFEFVLFFDCSEEEMERRLLERGKTSGRTDDNMESIRKRFKTFVDTSMPVISYYEAKGKVHRIDANKSIDDVTADVMAIFKSDQK